MSRRTNLRKESERLAATWRAGSRTPAWDELWRRIFSEMLNGGVHTAGPPEANPTILPEDENHHG